MPWSIRLEVIPSKFKCFGCLHVRSGTVLLAVLQIIIHFVVIAILTAALGRSTRFRNDVEYVALSISVMSFIQWERFVSEVNHTPVTVSKQFLTPVPEISQSTLKTSDAMSPSLLTETKRVGSYLRPSKFFLNAGEEYVAIAVTLFSLLFSIMMLVGTIYARPYYLLPYCCIQFLDLFVTCLSVVGYYTYLPESGALVRSRLWFSLLVVLGGIILLGMKTYLLAMVWLCYKFLIRYAAGYERSTGFSMAADSCMILFSLCRRCACCVCIPVVPSANLILSDLRTSSLRITTPNMNGSPQSSGGHIIVLLHNPPNGTALALPSSALVPNDRCMPPKYEDVLDMPVGAFGPPPYSDVAIETSSVHTDIYEHPVAEDLTDIAQNNTIVRSG